MRKVLDYATQSLSFLAGVAVILMLLQITIDVFCKYFFNMPLLWTMDVVASYMIVAIVFLPLAEVERQNSHIRVELLAQQIQGVGRRLIAIFSSLITIIYFGAVTWQTWKDAVRKYEVGEFVMGHANVTIWPSRFMLPIGCGLLVVLLLYKLWRDVTGQEPLTALGLADREVHADE